MLQRFFNFILNQLFPLKCLGCGEDDVKICQSCAESIKPSPQWQDFKDLRVWSAFEYNHDITQKIIQKWKYNADKQLLDIFFKKASFPNLEKLDGVIFVPLHRRRKVERGFNQAEQLARRVAGHYQTDLISGLSRTRYTKPQAQLEREQRFVNLKDVFTWGGQDIQGLSLLIVDDVVTTGSTLLECSKALKNAGAAKVEGLCLFRGG